MEALYDEIRSWRDALRSETYLSPSRAQDHLFAIWGELKDTPAARMVEQWLTLSVERELFSGAELVEFLDELEAYLKLHHSSQPAAQA
jgi:hypothetical protein